MATSAHLGALLGVFALVVGGPACSKEKGGSEPPALNVPGDSTDSSNPNDTAAKPGEVPVAPSRGPEHAVYSLEDNRLSAHLLRGGGLVIPGGSAGFVKYMRFGKSNLNWDIRSERDGVKAAIFDGTVGRLAVPLTADQAAGTPTLRLRVHNGKDRALSVRFNGDNKREAQAQMAAGWSTVTVQAPEGALREGENEILLFTGKGDPAAVAWIQIGGKTDGGAPADFTDFYDAKRGLLLPRGGGLAYYLLIPDDGRLTGDLDDAACKVEVSAVTDDGKTAAGTLVGRGAAVELGALAGKPARVTLVAQGCDQARLANAALVVPGEAPKVKDGPPPKYVVLWIMDSLRADRMKIINGKARPESPAFEELAKSSTVFAQTYVQGNESRVSHASIWSALYPVKHDMISDKAKLAKKWITIDEVAKRAGMYTSGVSANGYADPRWGIGEEWDAFRNHIHLKAGLKGEDVLAKGVESVDGKTDPWFLYLGTIDTHVSWRPKQPWIGKYHAPYSGRFARRFSGEDAGAVAGGKLKITDAEIKWVRALYDSNVSYQDDLLGQLLTKLKEWGIADQTMLIVTADHGDEQWEHGRVGHGQSLQETLVHVPMVIHYPPLFPAGKVTQGTEVIDIVPTMAAALGVDPSPEWQGESLIPLAQGVGRGYSRMSMASKYEGAHAGRMGRWKLHASGGSAEVYDVVADPEERKDLSDKAHIARRMLSDPMWLLRAYNTEWNKAAWGNAANTRARFPEHFGE